MCAGAIESAVPGDAHRCVSEAGVRYGHVVNPRNGWTIPRAPRSVTVRFIQ